MVVPTQVKLLRHHGRKLPEPHLERLIVLLVLLLQDNGQAAHLAFTPTFTPTFILSLSLSLTLALALALTTDH